MDKKLQQQIIQAKDIDQKARFDCKPGKLTMKNYTVYLVDLVNNDLIKHIIKEHGYPIQKMVGKKGMEAFWLLVQHQDKDVELQKQCLEQCDFEPKNKAFLTDRVLINQGKKQIYGTQFTGEIRDKKNVDKRRAKMGLESLESYLSQRKSE
jgi:hypothetical protein|tara:strand:+ start:3590 stop:4042 length:453 start_codon:yes stop_codon:yes gene_type:complete